MPYSLTVGYSGLTAIAATIAVWVYRVSVGRFMPETSELRTNEWCSPNCRLLGNNLESPTLMGAKIAEWAKLFWERLRETKPVLVSISREAIKHLAEAAQTSRATGSEIKSRLRVRGRQTALCHLRLICLRSEEALSADEIARRILAGGYSSRSKTFTAYIRRLLRQDGRFVVNADGLWMLRSAA